MKINIYDWPCGYGKTTAVLKNILTIEGRYLFAVARLDDISERRGEITDLAKTMNVRIPMIDEIRSDDGGGVRAVDNVQRAICMAASKNAPLKHVIIFCSHQGLMSADLSDYDGWHLVIDEAIQCINHRTECTPDLWMVYNRYYNLDSLNEHWSIVKAKPEFAPDRLRKNTGLSLDFQLFDRLARSKNGLFSSLSRWSDVDDGRRWNWFSVWLPTALQAFASVTVTAANFGDTLTAKIWRHACPDLDFAYIPQPNAHWARRPVVIQYFAEHHIAKTSIWNTLKGEPIRIVLKWIKNNTKENHYWGGNKEHIGEKIPTELCPPGDRISTKVAGSNNYIDYHCCSIIYTAKPDNNECRILGIYGIDLEEIKRAREYEDILQVVMRSSIRDRNSTSPVTIRVYDRQQAEFLSCHLPVAATLQHIDLGLDELVAASQPKSVSMTATMTPTQKAEYQRLLARERQRKHRAANRDLTASACSPPRRGRPPKNVDATSIKG